MKRWIVFGLFLAGENPNSQIPEENPKSQIRNIIGEFELGIWDFLDEGF